MTGFLPARRWVRLAAAMVGVLLGAGLVTPAVAASEPAREPAAARTAAAPVWPVPGGGVTVDAHGDRVPLAGPQDGAGPALFVTLQRGGQRSLYPAAALPLPGHGLDPSRRQADAPPITLRIRVIGAGGKPVARATAVGLNADDIETGFVFTDVIDGELMVSLPAGNYGFIVAASDPDTGALRIVNVVDYVLINQAGQTLTFDMRTADQAIGASTPRPAGFASLAASVRRTDRNGGFVGIAATTLDEQAPILVAPAPAAQVGTLSYAAKLQYGSPAGAPTPYTFNLIFGGTDGVPADVHYEVTEADLATIHNTYHTDGGLGQPASTGMFGFLPWQDLDTTADFRFTVPGGRTDFVTGREDAEWNAFYARDAVDGTGRSVGGVESYNDSGRRYVAGQQLAANWGRQPVHPGLATQTTKSDLFPFHCPACREDDRMRIGVTPFTDSAGHVGGGAGFIGDTPLGPRDTTGRIRLFAGDTKIAEGFSGNELEADVPAESTRFRLQLDQNRIAPWFSTGVRTTTEWGFTSAHPTVPGMPSNWRCGSIFEPPPAACVVLPLLVVGYDAPVDLVGVAPGGPAHLGLSVAPAQGAPGAAITSIAVDVSFDDGSTWTATTVSGTGGRFDAAFTAPTSGFVSTRVRATDSAGNTVSQTVTRAYALGPAAQKG